MTYLERDLHSTILVNLTKLGLTQKVIGQVPDVSQQMVSNLLRRHAQGLPTPSKASGAPRRLSPAQLARLPELLAPGAAHYGFKSLTGLPKTEQS